MYHDVSVWQVLVDHHKVRLVVVVIVASVAIGLICSVLSSVSNEFVDVEACDPGNQVGRTPKCSSGFLASFCSFIPGVQQHEV